MRLWSSCVWTEKKVSSQSRGIFEGHWLTDSGYIDLSKRRVSAEDIIRCEERFNKGKMVASIMRHVAEKTRTPMETLYQDIGWPLNKKYGHAVDAFKLSITCDPNVCPPIYAWLIGTGILTSGLR